MIKYRITSFDQIDTLLDKLHDYDFDLESLLYNSEERILSIRFFIEMPEYKEKVKRSFFTNRYKIPLVEHILIIHNVKDCIVEDIAKIRFYPFNTFKYSRETNKLEIIACVPLKLEILIDEFEIVLAETEKIIKWKNYKTLSFLDKAFTA